MGRIIGCGKPKGRQRFLRWYLGKIILEMGKEHGLNAGVEFFYKLSLRGDFQDDLAKARKHLAIPPSGFSNPKTRENLFIKDSHADMFDLLGTELHFKEKYDVPIPYWNFIDDYIFFGKPVNAIKNKIVSVVVSPTEEERRFYREINEPYLELLIFKNSTKTQVLDFIKKNWREMEISLNKNIYKSRRTRKTIYKDRGLAIRQLWRLPLAELQRRADFSTRERDLLIARILLKEGLTKKELSGGYIRKLVNRK